MTADVVRLLGERIMTAPPHPQWSPTTDLAEMLAAHLAGVVAPLLERAAAEAVEGVRRRFWREADPSTTGAWREAAELLDRVCALADVPAHPAVAREPCEVDGCAYERAGRLGPQASRCTFHAVTGIGGDW